MILSHHFYINYFKIRDIAMLTYDGLIIDAACYNIDGNNYFKLRDITDALDCRVEWNERTQQIEISTMTPAKEDPNEIKG